MYMLNEESASFMEKQGKLIFENGKRKRKFNIQCKTEIHAFFFHIRACSGFQEDPDKGTKM